MKRSKLNVLLLGTLFVATILTIAVNAKLWPPPGKPSAINLSVNPPFVSAISDNPGDHTKTTEFFVVRPEWSFFNTLVTVYNHGTREVTTDVELYDYSIDSITPVDRVCDVTIPGGTKGVAGKARVRLNWPTPCSGNGEHGGLQVHTLVGHVAPI